MYSYVSDLHPQDAKTFLVKFADDTYLIVGAEMRHTVQQEIDGVKRWAESHNLRLNATNSRELLVTRGGRWRSPRGQMERVDQLRILGVVVFSDL